MRKLISTSTAMGIALVIAACGSDATGPSVDGGQDLLLAPIIHSGLHGETGHGMDEAMPPDVREDRTDRHETGTEQK